MTKHSGWSGLAREVVLIVGSILLAFAINAWWEGRGDRAKEREALQALAADFSAADSILAVRVLAIDSGAVAAQAVIDLVGPHADPRQADSLAILIPHLIRRATFQPPMGTLEALLGSGELRLIRNAELKASLASFPSELEEVRETQGFGSEVVFTMLLPYLNTRVPMLQYGLMARGKSDFNGDPAGLLKSLEFENLAQNRLMGLRFSLQAAAEVGGRIAAIRKLLQKELAR